MAVYAQSWIGTNLVRGSGANVSKLYSMPPVEDVIRDIDETSKIAHCRAVLCDDTIH